MRKLLLFLFGTTNVNFSLLIISCDHEMTIDSEDLAVISQNNDEQIMKQFISAIKKIDFKVSEHDLPVKIQAIVLKTLSSFIKKNKKYQNISFTIEKISKINDDYIISLLSLLQTKQHLKFVSTLTVTIDLSSQDDPFKADMKDEKDLSQQQPIEIAKDEEKLERIEPKVLAASKVLQSFSSEYQEKFNVLKQEISNKIFEYEFAQTTYADFITTVLAPWFSERLIDLNYKLDVSSDLLLEEIMGNTIANFILHITFNNDEKTDQKLLIKVNCKEKAGKAYNTLNSVWNELQYWQNQNIQFEDLPSQPNYSDVLKRFEAKLKSKSIDYQNAAFIFKGKEESKSKTLLQKGNNKIDFTVAIDGKSFFYLWLNYIY